MRAVVVPDEAVRPRAERGRFAQLLGDPGVGRVARRADVHHPPRAERDDEERVGRAEEAVADRQGVAGPDLRGVVLQETGPGLPGTARWAGPAQGALGRRLGDADSALAALAPDAFRAPQALRPGQLVDQRDGLGREGRARRRSGGPGLPPPEPAAALALPAQGRVRLDDQRRRPPSADAAGQEHEIARSSGVQLTVLLRARSTNAPTAAGAVAGRMAAQSWRPRRRTTARPSVRRRRKRRVGMGGFPFATVRIRDERACRHRRW